MLFNTITALAILGAAQAHMHLHYPPTLLGDNNPHTPQGGADPKLNYPYGCCGQTNTDPCHGHLGLLDQPEGKPTASWEAGQKANFSISGHQIDSPISNPLGGTHAGGSSQIGISTDKGKTFKVVKTWNGNFPPHDNLSLDPKDQTFDFTVPSDLPSGDVVFAWTWVNREREFNMNCAVVTITGGSGNGDAPEEPEQPEFSEGNDTTQPEEPENSKYTLDGCTCECPTQSFTDACKCYSCESPTTKRRDVERRALAMHKRVRRAEVTAFSARPDMALNIDLDKDQPANSPCHSPGDPFELKFPEGGPDVETVDSSTPGGYDLAEPSCN